MGSTNKRFVIRTSSLETLRQIYIKVQTSWLNLISMITPSHQKIPPLHFKHALRLCTSDTPSLIESKFITELPDYIFWNKNSITLVFGLLFYSLLFPEPGEWDKQPGCFDQSSVQYGAETGKGRPPSLSQDYGAPEGAWDFCRDLESRGSREETEAYAVLWGPSVPKWGKDGSWGIYFGLSFLKTSDTYIVEWM